MVVFLAITIRRGLSSRLLTSVPHYVYVNPYLSHLQLLSLSVIYLLVYSSLTAIA